MKAESGRPWGSLVSCTTEPGTSVGGAAGNLMWRAIEDTQHQPGLRMLTHIHTRKRDSAEMGKHADRQADK